MKDKKINPKYEKKYDENSFWEKIKKHASKIGGELVHKALLLFYSSQRKETPSWAKATIYGALGYLIAPFDSIPDLTPLLGYTDDVTILAAAIATVAAYINDDVKEKAYKKCEELFGPEFKK